MATEFEKLERELRGKKQFGALADTPEGKALASQLDGAALARAVQQGDTAALQSALQKVLSTPEGRALAEKVQKAVGSK